jgi:hypothetical protein
MAQKDRDAKRLKIGLILLFSMLFIMFILGWAVRGCVEKGKPTVIKSKVEGKSFSIDPNWVKAEIAWNTTKIIVMDATMITAKH